MASTKFVELIRALQRATAARKIKWLKVTDNAFLSAIGESAASIRMVTSIDASAPDYYIAVLAPDGKVLEEASDSTLNSTAFAAFREMETLFESAKSAALGSSVAIDNILNDLRQIE
jgi:hypothetical protein